MPKLLSSFTAMRGIFFSFLFFLRKFIFIHFSGSCGVYGMGLECGGRTVVQKLLFDSMRIGRHSITLEFNTGCGERGNVYKSESRNKNKSLHEDEDESGSENKSESVSENESEGGSESENESVSGSENWNESEKESENESGSGSENESESGRRCGSSCGGKGTLHFFADGTLLTHRVIEIPQSVHFFVCCVFVVSLPFFNVLFVVYLFNFMMIDCLKELFISYIVLFMSDSVPMVPSLPSHCDV
jgi:hypothetical protein